MLIPPDVEVDIKNRIGKAVKLLSYPSPSSAKIAEEWFGRISDPWKKKYQKGGKR